MPEKPKIELRSDEVQEIMSHVPNWMIRRGIGLLLLLILLCLFITWFVKYPDVISGAAVLSTEQPSISLVTKSAGEISEIYGKDHQTVKKGDLLALIENTLSENSKNYLVEITKTVRFEIEKSNVNVTFNDEDLLFGALQGEYTNLKKAVLDYSFFIKNNSSLAEIGILDEQVQNHNALRNLNLEQLLFSKIQKSRLDEKMKSTKRLVDQGAISLEEYNAELDKVNSLENEIINVKKNAIQNSITLSDLKKQRFQLKSSFDKEANDLKKSILIHLANIENSLDNWGRNYEIRALIDGELSFTEKWSKNQYVKPGDILFAIVPKNQKYIGSILVPQAGFAKIETGQKVRLKIDNYPSHEFGQLNAVVSSISLLAKEKQYRIEFQLTNGLMSSYKKRLEYIPEMEGTADIITEDLRLSDRIFNKIAKIFSK